MGHLQKRVESQSQKMSPFYVLTDQKAYKMEQYKLLADTSEILNFLVNRSINAAAESLNAKIKML